MKSCLMPRFCNMRKIDMGRNIFQSTDPAAMIRAVGAVVHESAKPQAAYSMFLRPPAEGTLPVAPEARNTEASRGHGR